MEDAEVNGNRDNKYLTMAVEEAYKGFECENGYPYGAVIVRRNEIVARCHNMIKQHNDPTAHAEITAIREVCKKFNKWNLSDCKLYSSCEPCAMCLAAIRYANIKKVVYGARAEVAVATGNNAPFNSDLVIKQGESEAVIAAEQIFEKAKSKSISNNQESD